MCGDHAGSSVLLARHLHRVLAAQVRPSSALTGSMPRSLGRSILQQATEAKVAAVRRVLPLLPYLTVRALLDALCVALVPEPFARRMPARLATPMRVCTRSVC